MWEGKVRVIQLKQKSAKNRKTEAPLRVILTRQTLTLGASRGQGKGSERYTRKGKDIRNEKKKRKM